MVCGVTPLEVKREKFPITGGRLEGWRGRWEVWGNQETKWQPKRKAPSAVRRDQTGRR
jgi:hypothetical protein